jgi:hypothetical protein
MSPRVGIGWRHADQPEQRGHALVLPPIRRAALGLIEHLFYAASIVWLIIVAASIL